MLPDTFSSFSSLLASQREYSILGFNTREKSRYGGFRGALTRAMKQPCASRTNIRDRFYTIAISSHDIVSILQSRMQQSHSIDALADPVISEA